MSSAPRYGDVLGAHARIAPFAHRTPVLTSSTLDALSGASLFFKCESLQKVGAFKFRGACNAVFSMTETEIARGVATHSSGNHAAALALAGRLRGVPVTVVMPENASRAKQVAVSGYGARIVHCEPTQRSREQTLEAVIAETGAAAVHPFSDPRVIAGQGTAALELLDEVPGLQAVITPVGGGGLVSGTALAVKGRSPATRVIGAEPAGADDAARSLEAGRIIELEQPATVADGLRASRIGDVNFEIMRRHVDRIVRVEEQAIIDAMRALWQRMKLVVEPSGAVPLAALLGGTLNLRGQRVGIILSGGNVDLDALPW